MRKTIEYYDSTVNLDMSAQYNMFEKRLYAGAHILDLGCGSRRDAKYFLEQGYEVTVIDESVEFCEKTSDLTGIEVRNILFQNMEYIDAFDGVWACSSLVHIGPDKLPEILQKINVSLKDGGVFYMSFKLGEFSGERDGGYYTDLDEETFTNFINTIPEFSIREIVVSDDVGNSIDNQWISAIIIKHKNHALKIWDELKVSQSAGL